MEAIIDVDHPKRVRQQISIPFGWETKPGTPKQDWVSKPVSLISYPLYPLYASPSKLVVSVPFRWEEEPGKPLNQLPPPQMDLLTQSSSSWNPFLAEGDDYSIGFNLDNFNNPFVSGPTLPNVPISEPNLSETEEYSSSESSNTTQNGASGNNGFDMELLFALSSPEVSFLGNLFEKNGDDKLGPTGRRELTLGELIMLSRQFTRQNNPQIVQKKNPSKELMKKILFTCF